MQSKCHIHPQVEASEDVNGGFPHLHCRHCQLTLLDHISALEQENLDLQLKVDRLCARGIEDMKHEIKELRMDNGLLKISIEHTTRTLKQADGYVVKLEQQLAEQVKDGITLQEQSGGLAIEVRNLEQQVADLKTENERLDKRCNYYRVQRKRIREALRYGENLPSADTQ